MPIARLGTKAESEKKSENHLFFYLSIVNAKLPRNERFQPVFDARSVKTSDNILNGMRADVKTIPAQMREAMAALEWDMPPTQYLPAPAGHIVYFVGGDTGPVKIGFTQQPMKARLVCIQNGSPVKLRVLATVNANRNLERLYHRQFAEERLHGEWFERSPYIEAEIARLNAK